MTIDDGGLPPRVASVATAPRSPRPASRDLERYAALFAARTRGMTSSVMRDMMAITERPEVISLAGGLPDTSTFPSDEFAAIMADVAQHSARALQYGPTEGMAELRETIVEVMATEGAAVDPEDVLVTTGGQQVIDLVCKALIDPGDVIVAEGPTYPGAIPTFNAYQADVVQISLDEDGMSIDELEATLDRLGREGRRPKFIYTIPTFQNPGGVTMSLPRRRRLVDLAREREVLILEDNPYGALRYEGDPLPTLFSLDAANVIYIGTFSKILSPGVRLGWAAAPRPLLAKLNLGKQGADLCSSSLTQMFVAAYFKTGAWPGYVRSLRERYRRRRDTMFDALAEYAPPETTWTRPQGGLFVWATLPDWIDTTDLLALALAHNVAFVPGRAAFLDGRGGSSLRLNFSGVDEHDIREGIRRIGEVIAGRVGLYGSLTGSFPAISSEATTPPAPENLPAPVEPVPDAALADVLHLPRPGSRSTRRTGDAS